ncbi:MAG: F0F1 ATP synthase subunit delta [Candidatus Levyibacteriota bacterium]
MEQLNLTAFFTTKSQANEFATRLNAFSESVYHTNFSLEKDSLHYLGMKKSEAFLKLMQDNNIATDSASAIKSFIAKLQVTIKSLPLLTITIAFEPNEEVLHTLADWFVMNLNKQFLLEILIDPALVAGAIIKYKGAFMDASSKLLVEKIMQQNLAPHAKHEVVPEHRQTPENFHMGR